MFYSNRFKQFYNYFILNIFACLKVKTKIPNISEIHFRNVINILFTVRVFVLTNHRVVNMQWHRKVPKSVGGGKQTRNLCNFGKEPI